jgi:hypothetical protein
MRRRVGSLNFHRGPEVHGSISPKRATMVGETARVSATPRPNDRSNGHHNLVLRLLVGGSVRYAFVIFDGLLTAAAFAACKPRLRLAYPSTDCKRRGRR